MGREIGGEPLVESITLRGVDAFDDDEVKSALSIRPTRCRSLLFQPFCWFTEGGFFQERHRLDREALPRDELRLRVFYWLRGYRGTRAGSSVLPAEDGVEVRFEVEEGPPTLVRSVEVLQDSTLLSEEEIAEADPPPVDEPLDMMRLRLAERSLETKLRERGHANAVVTDSVTVDGAAGEEPAFADVRLLVEPGRPVTVEGIVVRGNEEVSDRTILRSLGLRIGQLYRRGDLDEAQRRLYRTNLFRQSFVTTLEDSPAMAAGTEDAGDDEGARPLPASPEDTLSVDPGDTTRTVLVAVREAPFDEIGAGIGFSTMQFIQAEARYARYNFLGGAQRLDTRASIGNILAPVLYDKALFDAAIPRGVGRTVEGAFLDPAWGVSIDFHQPFFYSADNSLGLGVFARRRSVIGVVIDRSYGGSATVTRRVSRGVPVSLRYQFEKTEVDAGGIYFCVNFGICSPRTVAALQRPQRLSPISLTVTAERVDDPADPQDGFTARMNAEHASELTASDYRYQRATAEGAIYRQVGPGVLAARVQTGWVRSLAGTAAALGVESEAASLLHPRKRLYSGGSRSVRGYAENQLGPRILTVALERLLGFGEDGAGCTLASVREGTCDASGLPTTAFQPRPLGGNRLAEGSVEFRFPLGSGFGGAVFVDAGYVGDLDLNIPTGARGAVTPGFGLRYSSPVGVIRVDLGVRPTLVERLPVVTALGQPGESRLITLTRQRRYDPVGRSDGSLERIYRRLVLHLSIGEAF